MTRRGGVAGGRRQQPSDSYLDETFRWWHLSEPSPELTAAEADGWLGQPGRALDAGCGLGTEAAYLASTGWQVTGVDRSESALRRASSAHPAVRFAQADIRALPFARGCFDLVLDRGCYHYLSQPGRRRYATELSRVLRPGGRLLLRACLTSAGVRNDVDEAAIAASFDDWSIDSMRPADLPSDTRVMRALEVRLRRADSGRSEIATR
jgi:SAM-dependent methyltransferase